MAESCSTVLLAAGPGSLRDALRALLISIPDLTILEAADAASAEAFLRAHHPDLVMIDGDLPGNHSMQLVHAIHVGKTASHCLLLANTVTQQVTALRAGADEAPVKGVPAARVFAQVEHFLSPQ